ncbi:MAG: hypothetical protein J6T08_05105 [Lentisphaeria bacterium]|nr:hypothetical protein [Lentisphaeria bacterium]
MPINYQDCWTYPKEEIDAKLKAIQDQIDAIISVPTYAKTDNGKVLKVDGSGTNAVLVWGTDNT